MPQIKFNLKKRGAPLLKRLFKIKYDKKLINFRSPASQISTEINSMQATVGRYRFAQNRTVK